MLDTRLRVKAAVLAGGSVSSTLVVADASTLLKGEAAVQTSNFRKGLDFSPGAGAGTDLVCPGGRRPAAGD